MRLSLWLLALTALSTGGCVFPCTNGACSSSGEPRYVTPTARFFGTEKLLPQKLMHSDCASGKCQPSPYLTCSKYLPFMDKWSSSSMAKRCADRYLLKQQFQTRCWLSKHYKAGFRDAFMDVANGESGEVPAVPPPKYWNTHYRTEKGKRCVEQYFDGYRSASALAMAEMNTMKTIGASYDWSIEKPKQPCSSSALLAGNRAACSTARGCSLNDGCSPGGGYSTGNPTFAGQMPTYPQGMPNPMGPPSAGCNMGQMPTEQPSVFSVGPQPNPQPAASGIGPTNSYPTQNNYGPAPIPDPGFDQRQNQYQLAPNQFGAALPAQPQQPPGYTHTVPNLPSPTGNRSDSGRNLNLPSPALPAPGYAGPSGNTGAQPSPQNQFSQPLNNQPGGMPRQSGPLTPGYSGSVPGRALPGKLGPPDEFKNEPPAWRYPPPQR